MIRLVVADFRGFSPSNDARAKLADVAPSCRQDRWPIKMQALLGADFHVIEEGELLHRNTSTATRLDDCW